MGLTLIAKAINLEVFLENNKFFAAIVIVALVVDIIDTYKRWSK